jgi:hypothetical protein
MTTITWNLQVERGASNASFNSKVIFRAMNRIARYWNVNFVQVSRNPYMRFLLTTKQPNPTWAAWTSGRTVNIGRFRFASDVQAEFVMTHELGHVFGGSQHAPSGHVMSPSVEDVYRNFTQLDTHWFRLPMRGSPKPWKEPAHWRPMLSIPGPTGIFDAGLQPCNVGHGSWSDWFNGFRSYPVEAISE